MEETMPPNPGATTLRRYHLDYMGTAICLETTNDTVGPVRLIHSETGNLPKQVPATFPSVRAAVAWFAEAFNISPNAWLVGLGGRDGTGFRIDYDVEANAAGLPTTTTTTGATT